MELNIPPPVFRPIQLEEQKAMTEALQSNDPALLDHSALKRCASETSVDPLAQASQAYDRMYHTHNRG